MPHTPSTVRIGSLLLALLLQACAAPGSGAAPQGAAAVAVAAALKRQADAWDEAIVRKDLAAIAANMTDDFRQIGSNGEVENRESFLRDLMLQTTRVAGAK